MQSLRSLYDPWRIDLLQTDSHTICTILGGLVKVNELKKDVYEAFTLTIAICSNMEKEVRVSLRKSNKVRGMMYSLPKKLLSISFSSLALYSGEIKLWMDCVTPSESSINFEAKTTATINNL